MVALFWLCIAVMVICNAIKREIEINKEFQKMYDEAMKGINKHA
jgi:hypothetical protein